MIRTGDTIGVLKDVGGNCLYVAGSDIGRGLTEEAKSLVFGHGSTAEGRAWTCRPPPMN